MARIMQNNPRMISSAGSILPFIHELHASPTPADSDSTWGRCLRFDPGHPPPPDLAGSQYFANPFNDPEAA
jgi:hypothetical protein